MSACRSSAGRLWSLRKLAC